MRHCAYCLKSIAAKQVKCCAKCHKRVYCSKECQTIDWNSPDKGQKHKLWCGKAYGEEDIDWEVREIEGKGLGVVALRDMDAHFLIMVERWLDTPNAHPALANLFSPSGLNSLETKFSMNAINSVGDKGAVGLRISRINHACFPRYNASHDYDEENCLLLLFSNRAICKGEEITIGYSLFGFVLCDTAITAEYHRFMLRTKWNICCSSDCPCYQPVSPHLKIIHQLHKDLQRCLDEVKVEKAIEIAERLLELYKTHFNTFISMRIRYFELFRICISQKKFLEKGMFYIREVYNLSLRFTGENCGITKYYKKFMENPASHKNYLLVEDYANEK